MRSTSDKVPVEAHPGVVVAVRLDGLLIMVNRYDSSEPGPLQAQTDTTGTGKEVRRQAEIRVLTSQASYERQQLFPGLGSAG